jgi:hypothetical protein
LTSLGRQDTGALLFPQLTGKCKSEVPPLWGKSSTVPEQNREKALRNEKLPSLDNKREISYIKTSAVSGKFFES